MKKHIFEKCDINFLIMLSNLSNQDIVFFLVKMKFKLTSFMIIVIYYNYSHEYFSYGCVMNIYRLLTLKSALLKQVCRLYWTY